MTRAEFERVLAGLRERVAGLPEDRRVELEALVGETLARHEEIHRASLQAHRAAERLELGLERLKDACERLAGAASEARATLERLGSRGPRPLPGVN